MADHRHAPLAEPGGRPIVVRTDDDHLGGRNRRMRERMRPGRHAAGDLDIECSFLDPAGPDRLVSPLHHPAQVVRREIQLPETSLQPRQVLHFQPAPALVHPEDLVDRVAEQETPVPDRDLGLLHRHDLSIQTRQNLHRRRSFPGSSADHLVRPRNDRIIGLTAGGQCRPGTPRDGSSEAVLATSGQSSLRRLRRHVDRFDRIVPPRPADQAIEMGRGISPDEQPTQHRDDDPDQARGKPKAGSRFAGKRPPAGRIAIVIVMVTRARLSVRPEPLPAASGTAAARAGVPLRRRFVGCD